MQNSASRFFPADEIAACVRAQLTDEMLRESGATFGSGHCSMKRGDFYIMGFNPGGNPEKRKSIGSQLEYWENKPDHNAYCDEYWISRKGESKLQKRVRWLCAKLIGGEDAKSVREVCAANLIFHRSKNAAELKEPAKKAALCWPVHRYVLTEIVRPKAIVTFGGETYWHLQRLLEQDDSFGIPNNSGEEIPAGYADWKCRRFSVNAEFAESGTIWIFGLPHLSYWKPDKQCPQIAEWIKEKI